MPDAFPKLRDEVDAAPASRDGEVFYIIYDRAGIVGSRLIVSPLALLVASRLDGKTSILDLADSLAAEAGPDSVSCREINEIVAALDEAMFLDNSAFQDYMAQAERDFRTMEARPASSAGSAYSDEPKELAESLEQMLNNRPPAEETPSRREHFPAGIISPHIDYARGAHGYGQIYGLLRERSTPATVVVLGTAHLPISQPFSLCEKDYETPLGTVKVDHEAAQTIREALQGHAEVDKDILAHRGEHSIELQTIWLRHIYGDNTRIVPILVNSLSEYTEGNSNAADAREVPALKALADCLASMVEKGDVMLMASADLSHVGPRFGDERELSNQFLGEVELSDREYLAAVVSDPVLGLQSLDAHGDRHHICGSAPIFVVGMALQGRDGKLLGYHQALTPEMRQAVTYASLIFE